MFTESDTEEFFFMTNGGPSKQVELSYFSNQVL